MEKNDRKKRLNEAIKYLISIGMIDGKSPAKSISITMNRNSSNISSTTRGDERYLNSKFVRDFCATYKNIISEEWIWSGVGEMLTDTSTYNTANSTITEESLMKLSREELVFLVKQLMSLHSEQTECIAFLSGRMRK